MLSSTLLLLSIVLLPTLPCSSYLTLVETGTNNEIFSSPSAYSPSLVSNSTFNHVQGTVMVINDDVCSPLHDKQFDPTIVYVIASDACDLAVQLTTLYNNGARIVINLYDGTVRHSDPHDAPVRFAYSPPLTDPRLILVRVHGADAHAMWVILQNVTIPPVTASLHYSPDPWRQTWLSGPYIYYMVLQNSFFCVYLFQHSLRSLLIIHRTSKKMHTEVDPWTFQQIWLTLTMTLSIVCILDRITENIRDYSDNIWMPNLIPTVFYFVIYIIEAVQIALLALYWFEILNATNVATISLKRWRYAIFVIVTMLLVFETVMTSLYVFGLPYHDEIRSAAFAVIGVLILIEALALIGFGSQIIYLLVRAPNGTGTISRDTQLARRRKALPITRLVVVGGILLLILVIISFMLSLSDWLQSPSTYWYGFFIVTHIAILLQLLMLWHLSPIWLQRKKNWYNSIPTTTNNYNNINGESGPKSGEKINDQGGVAIAAYMESG